MNKTYTQQWRASTAPQRPAHWPKLRMLAGPLLRHEVAELIVLQRQKVFDKTCCSPNSTLPRQLMYGEAIIG